MEVTDFRNDVILAEACRGDVDKYCAKVEPGEALLGGGAGAWGLLGVGVEGVGGA